MGALGVIREFDPWKSPLCTCPRKYSLHPYTGCSHSCLYCYATSYIRARDSKPKEMFLQKLARDLGKLEENSIVELSTSSDPYPPIEEKLGLTREALQLISRRNLKILITTKSSSLTRDADILAKTKSAVMLTITTLDEGLARAIEPNAPSPAERLDALRKLSRIGVPVGLRIDPIIPLVNEDSYCLEDLIGRAKEAGALHVVTSTYKAKPDSLKRLSVALPDVYRKLEKLYVEKGKVFHGYFYLPVRLRRKLLQPVIDYALKYNLTIATCREGLRTNFPQAPSCDGSHLTLLRSNIAS